MKRMESTPASDGSTHMIARRRGQPLALLAALLVGYGGLRAAVWETPFPYLSALSDPAAAIFAEAPAKIWPDTERWAQMRARPADDAVRDGLAAGTALAARADAVFVLFPQQDVSPAAQGLNRNPSAARSGNKVQGTSIGHALLVSAGSAETSAPADVAAITGQGDASDRWSLYGWLFLREGSPALAANAIRPASYGASQAGAVLRYQIAPASKHRPTAYARAIRALSGDSDSGNDSEAALGLSARPFAGVPVSTHAEMRVRSSAGRIEARPAAFVVSEFPPAKLPLGMVGEAYVQAGYVGGAFATGFADGQARISRDVADVRLGKLRVGAGAWGGAQRDAARLDVGPSASVDFSIAGTNARAQVDYRIRVAGDASPDDGIAFTLSTGL